MLSPADIAEGQVGEPADAKVWERRMKALTLRNAGYTYDQIAEKMGYSKTRAASDVRAVLREIVAIPADQMVQRQRAILLDITRVNYHTAMSGDHERQYEAQQMLIRCLEHEAKLYGLYAPTRVNVGISQDEFAAQAAELLAAVGEEPLRELAGIRNPPLALAPHPPESEPLPHPTEHPTEHPDVIDVETESWSNL